MLYYMYSHELHNMINAPDFIKFIDASVVYGTPSAILHINLDG